METSGMTEDQLRSLLRVALGVMFLAHSIVYMLLTLTLPETAKFFVSIGLPAWLAYATFLAEALGGILLILGIQTRWVALVLSPILIGATWAHAGNGWLFASANGGWEYPLYLFVLCIAQAMLGDGAYALAPSRLPMAVQARHQLLRSDSGRPSARDGLPPRCPLWIKSELRSQRHSMSVLPSKADIETAGQDVR
jgi:putative oxidoreductase